jgi:ribonuclease HI
VVKHCLQYNRPSEVPLFVNSVQPSVPFRDIQSRNTAQANELRPSKKRRLTTTTQNDTASIQSENISTSTPTQSKFKQSKNEKMVALGVLDDTASKTITRKVKKLKVMDDDAVRRKYNIPPDAETIYTDGACHNNGKRGAKAGIGVFFAPDDARNISARLPGQQQTNQRAELFAVLKALETLYINRSTYRTKIVFILSDSVYVVDGLSRWIYTWERHGWETTVGNTVISKDVFKRAKDMLSALAEDGVFVSFRHVPGHRGVCGNEEADKLARKGATLPEVNDPQWSKDFNDEDLDDMIKEMQEYDDDSLDEIIAEMEDI